MNHYAIFRRHAFSDDHALERAASRACRVANEEMPDRVRWLRSYVCEEDDGTLCSVCIFQAVDRDAVLAHARRAGLACDTVLPIARTLIVADETAH
jgi:uncharacterized protein DUF4242